MEDNRGFTPEAFCSNCKHFKLDPELKLHQPICCSPKMLTKARVKKLDDYCPFHEFTETQK